MIHRGVTIEMDVNKDRLREIVSEALRMLQDHILVEFNRPVEEIKKELDVILNSDRVSVQFFLDVGNKKIPDLRLRVDPRRRKVLCTSKYKDRLKDVNYFMRIL